MPRPTAATARTGPPCRRRRCGRWRRSTLPGSATRPPASPARRSTAFGPRLPCAAALQLPTPHDRAAALARLARAAWQRGEAVDAALALPLYLRDKVALTTAERDVAKAAKAAAAGVA